MKEIIQQEPLIQIAVTIENVFSSSEEESCNYDLREGSKHDFASAISSKLKESIKQEVEKWIIKGIERGFVKGIEKGKIEEKYNIARNLLSMNMNYEDISKVTGLSIEEIKKL